MAKYDIDLVATSAPHIRDKVITSSIMRNVILALAPAVIGSIFIFGAQVLWVYVVSIISSVLAEYLGSLLFHKKPSLSDFSAIITGVLLVMTLPPSSPWWMVMVGAFSGILLGKVIFGGIGSNPFNPALVGRAVLMVSWPTIMTTWVKPRIMLGTQMIQQSSIDAITTATPLNIVKFKGYTQLFI